MIGLGAIVVAIVLLITYFAPSSETEPGHGCWRDQAALENG